MAFGAKKSPPSIDLAVVVPGPKGKKPPPSMGAMGDEEGLAEEMAEGEAPAAGGAFDVAFEEFDNPELGPEERKAAFKRAVMACMGGGY